MNPRSSYLILAAGLASAVLFAAQQRSLSKLRATNEALRRQLSPGPVTSPVSADVVPANVPAPLTPEEQSELLRLRGQIGPLHRELEALSKTARQ